MYTASTIAPLIDGTILQKGTDSAIDHLCVDSRRVVYPQTTLFFALSSAGQDGHFYLTDAFEKGIRNFIVKKKSPLPALPEANVVAVTDVLLALQTLAAHHRFQFAIPVVGITGSNGKTIVKEWLYQLLHEGLKIIRSPKSYNSQIGVPLSVWQMGPKHNFGIFEAGISLPGEMERLEKIIRPTIGVLTNIGQAHSEGFDSMEQKLQEKAKLFKQVDVVIGPQEIIQKVAASKKIFGWGNEAGAGLRILNKQQQNAQTQIDVVFNKEQRHFLIPFTDEASVQNAITCICVLLFLKLDVATINKRLQQLHSVDMRLQLKHGANNCTIINDSYSADLTSLTMALQFLRQQHAAKNHTAILSDFVETGKREEELYKDIAEQLQVHAINKVIAIGEKISHFLPGFLPTGMEVTTYVHTEDFLTQLRLSHFQNETILVKGARRAGFERIVQALESKVHQTLLEVNLSALAHNLKAYKNLLQPATKLMAMVKAFSYGSGGAEIASVLQFHKADYLGVAYADEGILLRKAGIRLPIMVMNADASTFAAIVEHGLQPVLYSFSMLQEFTCYLEQQALQDYPVHIEIETGMNRLGFPLERLENLGKIIANASVLKVESVFSHLAASEDPQQDAFTLGQAKLFDQGAAILSQQLAYPFLKHLANSAAIIRHPNLQYDMVRLGIGLYGVELETSQLDLHSVATLKTTIAQLKPLKKGETVSYNRKGLLARDSLIATVRIGYADGYSRKLGYGKGKMWLRGKLVPVVGTVCMDMTMVDVTDVADVKEGDEVIVFGKEVPIEQVAAWSETIPYEIMTSISQRVKRVYFQE